MVRVSDIETSLHFYVDVLGLIEIRRTESERGRFTLIFLSAPSDITQSIGQLAPQIELTYNWDPEEYTKGRNFGHLAYQVDNIYETCQKILKMGSIINRPPRDGRMAFINSPDGISIELLQNGDPLQPCEPWVSMANVGSW
tara:strand:- start:509 stop:931 length:423 start_codon:yes stop_codon:yes gene_type:complete